MNTPRYPLHPLRVQVATHLARRYVSRTSNTKASAAAATGPAADPAQVSLARKTGAGLSSFSSPLAKLPLSSVLRSLLILSVSSSPILLKPCIYTLSVLANPRSSLFDVAKNPLLNSLVKHTIYRQFNAGENKLEVQRSIRDIKSLGYRGVLLGYARELLVGEGQATPLGEEAERAEVKEWLDPTLQTVDMAQEGDFVALKYAVS